MLQSTLNYKSIYIWLKDWSRDKVYFWVVLQDERLATKESDPILSSCNLLPM